VGVHSVPAPFVHPAGERSFPHHISGVQRGAVVSVQAPETVAMSWSEPERLRAGESLRFGTCACQRCAVDIHLEAGPGDWCLGILQVRDDHWRLSNLTPCADLLVHDLEDPTQRHAIGPGRLGVVVPFELARVGFDGHDPGEMMTVFAYEPTVIDEPVRACAAFAARFSNLSLNPEAGYVAVLYALCRDGSAERLPTSEQIAEKLAAAGTTMTRRAVDHHIDYLFRRLFPHHADLAGRPGWKRAAIAAAARRTGIVERLAARSQA
jgi:hypothetical protein